MLRSLVFPLRQRMSQLSVPQTCRLDPCLLCECATRNTLSRMPYARVHSEEWRLADGSSPPFLDACREHSPQHGRTSNFDKTASSNVLFAQRHALNVRSNAHSQL